MTRKMSVVPYLEEHLILFVPVDDIRQHVQLAASIPAPTFLATYRLPYQLTNMSERQTETRETVHDKKRLG
jgi:hypothetical protein